MPLSDLYVDIWRVITPHITTKDLLNLRLINRALNETASADVIWKHIVHQRWFAIHDIPQEPFRMIHDYLKYYIARNRRDWELIDHLQELQQLYDSSGVLDETYRLVEDTGHDFVPILLRMKRTALDLGLRYLCGEALACIRKAQGLRIIDACVDMADAEKFFLGISYLDPSFDDLLPFRKKVLDKVIFTVNSQIKNEDYDKPPTFKVNMIANCLFRYVFNCEDYSMIQNSNDYRGSEDFSILRVYSGEVQGILRLQYAIIQKVASHFGIVTRLTDSFLIVEDPSFNEGIALLFLKKKRAQFISLNYLRQLFRGESITDRLLPMQPTQLLQKPPAPRCSIIDKLVVETSSLNSFEKLFKHSHTPLHANILNLLWLFKADFQGQAFKLDFQHHILEFPLDLVIFRWISKDKTLYKLSQNIFDLPNEGSLVLCPREELSADLPHPQYRPGEILFHPRYKAFGVVVCSIYEEDITVPGGNYEISYSVITIKLKPWAWRHAVLVKSMSQDLLNYLHNLPLLGRYFDRFDPVQGRFIINENVKGKLDGSVLVNHFHERY